jgi:hypothetical protein
VRNLNPPMNIPSTYVIIIPLHSLLLFKATRPLVRERPNPSFNLTFSGWLRQPPNAS